MSPFLAVSDNVLMTTVICGMISSLVTAWLQVKYQVKANANAVKSEANQQQMAQQVQEVKEVGRTTHGLVNSAMVEQKRVTWLFAKRAAEVTKDQKDIALSDEAKKIYDDAVINAAKMLQGQKTQ